MSKMLCRDRDLQAINVEKRQFGRTMDVEINNVIYMELYSGPKMAHGKYGKTNIMGSIDRDSTVFAGCTVGQCIGLTTLPPSCADCLNTLRTGIFSSVFIINH
jgi:hypothetical protein